MGELAVSGRNTTKGWTPIPSSLIENQAVLTHGELSLALVVLRRGGNGIPVSDRNWQSWTGLSPRLKEMAIKGLREKGLTVNGRGEDARFTWDGQHWHQYLKHAPAEKPRTAGRQVDPKPGAKVHTECRERGCAMLRPECASGGLSLVSSTPVAQPVAQTPSNTTKVQQTSVVSSSTASHNQLTVLSSTPNAKRVSQTDHWTKTLAALKAIFPLIGMAFVLRLLAAVKVLFADVTDSELANAVTFAWEQTKGKQKSEGLFLFTVPDALAARRAPNKRLEYSPPDDYDEATMEEIRAVAADPAHAYSILGGNARLILARAKKKVQ